MLPVLHGAAEHLSLGRSLEDYGERTASLLALSCTWVQRSEVRLRCRTAPDDLNPLEEKKEGQGLDGMRAPHLSGGSHHLLPLGYWGRSRCLDSHRTQGWWFPGSRNRRVRGIFCNETTTDCKLL